jgi:hypothetical protein
MNLTPLRLADLSSIQVAPSLARVDGGPPVLVLAFRGAYRRGSEGNPDAQFLVGVTAQLLATWPGAAALVFDLCELTYTWGDGLLRVFDVELEPDLTPLPRAAVVSERSGPALRSLLAGGAGFVFDDLEAAVRHVSGRAAELRALERAHEDELEMYILVKDTVPLGFAMAAAAQASLAAYRAFAGAWETRLWILGVHRKVVCRVSEVEFERARRHPDRVVLTDPALGGAEVAIAFQPRVEWPDEFRSYPPYR